MLCHPPDWRRPGRSASRIWRWSTRTGVRRTTLSVGQIYLLDNPIAARASPGWARQAAVPSPRSARTRSGITGDGTAVRTLVISAREDLEIAGEARRLLGYHDDGVSGLWPLTPSLSL